MSANRRFFALEKENSIFKFTVDTRNTIGSESNLEFNLPMVFDTGFFNNFILKVNDGRSDVVVTNANSNLYKKITFATPGIYEIEFIGVYGGWTFNGQPDKLKIILISSWGRFSYRNGGFSGCTNLVVNSVGPLRLIGPSRELFNGIKGFGSLTDLSQYDVSKATDMYYAFANIQTPLPYVFQGFFLSATNLQSLYHNSILPTSLNRLEIIGPNVIGINTMLKNTGFQGDLIVTSNALSNIRDLLGGITNPPSLGKVDVRRVGFSNNMITSVMSVANVDATLLGWQNNFNWSEITTLPTRIDNFDFYNSKYSNNPAVIAAKAFLESKGIVFTRLTMA